VDGHTSDAGGKAHPHCCAEFDGFGLHAGTALPAYDREGIEHLLRYMCRHPVARERLEELPDGRLLYHLKRRWRDGTDRVVFEPLEFLERLAALVPAPRFNMIRYSGVLAAAASWRARLVPRRQTQEAIQSSAFLGGIASVVLSSAGLENPTVGSESALPLPRKHRPIQYAWAELLKHGFAVDALECEQCGGRMRILCAVNPPEAIRKILDCLGMPIRAPPIAPAKNEFWGGEDVYDTPVYSDDIA
jgi:hypothetical protein